MDLLVVLVGPPVPTQVIPPKRAKDQTFSVGDLVSGIDRTSDGLPYVGVVVDEQLRAIASGSSFASSPIMEFRRRIAPSITKCAT